MFNKPFRIGRFAFLELLDRGGMAEVYRVKVKGAQGFQKEVAIKRILPMGDQEAVFSELLAEEARLCSSLTHPNIAQVYDFIVTESEYLLVMEFIHGKNLARVLGALAKNGKDFSLAAKLFIGVEVCKGLDYAHTKTDPSTGAPLGIIHRDISPQNVMISFDGAVKLLDFGIAKATSRAPRTEVGTIKGKLSYMSPEQAMAGQLDLRSDIFSLGTVLYELSTGEKLFSKGTDWETIETIRNYEIPAFPSGKELTDFDTIIGYCLAKDRDARYSSAGELQAALQTVLNANFPNFTVKELKQVMLELFPTDAIPKIDSVEDLDEVSEEEASNRLAELKVDALRDWSKSASDLGMHAESVANKQSAETRVGKAPTPSHNTIELTKNVPTVANTRTMTLQQVSAEVARREARRAAGRKWRPKMAHVYLVLFCVGLWQANVRGYLPKSKEEVKVRMAQAELWTRWASRNYLPTSLANAIEALLDNKLRVEVKRTVASLPSCRREVQHFCPTKVTEEDVVPCLEAHRGELTPICLESLPAATAK